MVTYGVSVNTAGWEEHDHQDTGMDGVDHTYIPATQALRGICKGGRRDDLQKEEVMQKLLMQ